MAVLARPFHITDKMIEAGDAAYMEWFRQPDILYEAALPSKGQVQALASAIFASMILCKPLS